MVATRGCNLHREDFLSSSPLFVPIWIVDSNVVRSSDCLEGRLALRSLNN